MSFSKINEKLCTVFLFIALFFNPIYKYCENMLEFPRINITAIYIIILILLIMVSLYSYKDFFENVPSSSFILLIMVSLIQLISFPWAIDYVHDGANSYFKVIARTIIQYWLFWFAGLYIHKIWKNDRFWKIMLILWFFASCLIISNALSNNIFAIILSGKPIYLLLGDSFAILSIFILCKADTNKKQFFIIALSSICLFALFSRASLYCFIATILFFLYKKNKLLLIGTICVSAIFMINSIDDIANDRMFRVFSGSFDKSQQMRSEQLNKGLEDLSDVWILGSFMGDLEENFGVKGNYMHNYLSFWRQFGIVPFLIFLSIIIPYILKTFYYWQKSYKNSGFLFLLFYLLVFSFLEIVLARAFLTPYIWLSLSSLYVYFKSEKMNCK